MGEYTAVVYQTTSGRVLYDIDLVASPTWATTLNGATDSWSIITPLENSADRTLVREWAEKWFCSVAIMWNDQVVQAGPITQNPELTFVGDQPAMSITGRGFWEILNQRLLHNNAWNPASVPITDASANLQLINSLGNIAITILFHSLTWANRPGSALPVDLQALDPAGGSAIRNYFGYDLVSVGQRLQELTQVDSGPDIFFQPYKVTTSNQRYIRHLMRVGLPYLTQTGSPLLFDLNSAVQNIAITADSSPLIVTSFVKGAGNEAGQLIGYATSTKLPNLGWPALDNVDVGHSSATEQTTLDSWAAANIAQFGRKVEQWKPRVLLDSVPSIGSYTPGFFGRYAVNDHPWVPDGVYTSRILGIASAGGMDGEPAMVEHQIEAVAAS